MRLFVLLFLGVWLAGADAQLAAFSIDIGSQFTKIGLVKPGVPLDIVLNRESQRKTATTVAFKGEERFFSDQAINQQLKKPDTAFVHLVDLLGKTLDNPVVKLHQRRFPVYSVQAEEDRGSVAFKVDDAVYSVETLMAMIIREAKRMVEKFAGQKVSDCIITVPPYFNQAERRAMVNAASIAGVNLLQLMNDNTAAGVNYGMFRRKAFNESATTMLLYDMGATKTTATVLQYQIVKDKVTLSKDPQMTVLGVGYDRTIGGLELTLCIRDQLVKQFKEKAKTSKPVDQVPRAMGKLMKEAERVKQVLSSNVETYAQVENVMEDQDFRQHWTRDEFVSLCGHLIERSALPVADALRMSELSPVGRWRARNIDLLRFGPSDQIDTVVLMGGGTRVPLIQAKLQEAMNGKELGKFINTDEAAALGAVYQAAALTKGFKVKKFIVKEANLFPLQVDFNREHEPEEATAAPAATVDTRVIHRTLFNVANPYPLKKVMTFNKHTKDFDFRVNYGQLKFLNKDQIQEFGVLNVSACGVTGLTDAIEQHAYEGSEYKGVKVHFRMDEAGILNTDSAEAIFEKTPEVLEKEAESAFAYEEQTGSGDSMFSAFGKKLSGFFGGGDKNEEKEKESKNKDESDKADDQKAEKTDGADSKTDNEEAKPKSDDDKKKEKQEKTKSDDDKSKEKKDTDNDEKKKEKKSKEKEETAKTDEKADANNATANATDTKESKPKERLPRSLKVPLTIQTTVSDQPNITADQFTASTKILKHYDDIEAAKFEREEAQNAIESFVFETTDKLEQNEYRPLVSDEEYEKLKTALGAANTWLEDEAGFDTPTQQFKDKLTELKKLSKDMFYRFDQAKDRPKAEEAIKQMLNYSVTFLSGMKNLTEEQQIFTEVEIDTLEKMINDTQKWWGEKQEEQAKLAAYDKPAYTITEAAEKINALDREVKYLINKAKITPRKTKTDDKKNTTSKSSSNETSGSDEEEPSLETSGSDEEPTTTAEDETQEQAPPPTDTDDALPDIEEGDDDEAAAAESTQDQEELEVQGDDEDSQQQTDTHEDL